MFVNQTISSIIFSTIRVLLQYASLYFLKNLLSRYYNLTYMERVNAGILSKLKYVFHTKFPAKKKHVFARFIIMTALITSVCLTWIPSLLSELFPVKQYFISKNDVSFSLDYPDLKLAVVKPSLTDPSTLLKVLGLDTNDSKFAGYSISTPPPSKCTHNPVTNSSASASPNYPGYGYSDPNGVNSGITMTCFGDSIVSIGTNAYVDKPVMLYTSTNPQSSSPPPFNTTKYTYFNLTMGIPNLNVIYDTIGSISSGIFSEDTENGLRSVESCLAYTGQGRQCVRNTVGYLIVDKKGIVVSQKKLIYDGAKSDRGSGSMDCSKMITPTIQDMCTTLDENIPLMMDKGVIIGLQSMVNTENGIQWDILWMESNIQGSGAYNQVARNFGAISFQVNITGYAGTPNTKELWDLYNNTKVTDQNCRWGQELFEATTIYMTKTYQSNSSWAEWNFSEDDVKNMTDFILQGSPLYEGATIMTAYSLLVEIPNLVLYIIGGVIIFLGVAGYIAGFGVNSTVNKPFSEVIAITADPANKSKHFWNKNTVANLTLKPEYPFIADSKKGKDQLKLHIDNVKADFDDNEDRKLLERK